MKKYLIYAFTLLVFTLSANAQESSDAFAESVRFERLATEEYKAKNYPKFLENIARADHFRPGHAVLLYNLAAANALSGKTSEALSILERLAAMRLFFEIEKDEDFRLLRADARFKKVSAAFSANLKSAGKAEKAFAMPEKGLNIEGIAYDSASKRFFISSILGRKIFVIDERGKTAEFSSATDGLWSVFGMRVDEKREVLWATTNALPKAQNPGEAGVFKYDLRTGKLLKKYLIEDGKKHVLGDLLIAANGDVFASDSFAPNIYRIAAEENAKKNAGETAAKNGASENRKGAPELFLSGAPFASLQGLAFSADEKYLFAADYAKGIFRVSLNGKSILQIKPDAHTNALGIDGLYFKNGNLIAIQNGFRPYRVARFVLNKDFTRITKSETLVANYQDFNEPTLGVVIKNDFFFVANSHGKIAGDGGANTEKLTEPVIMRTKL